MTIDDAIKMLTESKEAGVKSIILSFWEAESFDLLDDNNWKVISESVERDMDWSCTTDDLLDGVTELNENAKAFGGSR